MELLDPKVIAAAVLVLGSSAWYFVVSKAKSDQYGPLTFPKLEDVNDEVPTEETIAKIADFPVFDADGKEVCFRSLYEGAYGEKKSHKTLVFFIRHFFCGSCQDFVEYISKSLPSPTELETLPVPASIVIIGCGESSLIPFYIEKTSSAIPIYGEPTTRLYSVLRMSHSTEFGDQIPEYIKTKSKSKWQGFKRSFPQFLGRIRYGDALKGGSGFLLGGDFLFENGKVIWCHRMRNVADHVDVPKIRKLLGIPPS